MLNNLLQMHLKQFSTRATQKTGETTATKIKKKKITRNTKKYIDIYRCTYISTYIHVTMEYQK